MKIGMLSTVNEYSVDPATLARKAEALGFESLWLPDHAVMPVHTTTPLPETPPGQGQIPELYSHMCDPFVAMAMAAAATTRLKVATGVLPGARAQSDPDTANEIATLDHFSDGRVMFGIGAGWLKEESEMLGADFPHRWTPDQRIHRRDARAMDQRRGLVRGQVRQVPAGAALSEAGAQRRSADPHRQQGQKRAALGRAMGRRLVPDFLSPDRDEGRSAKLRDECDQRRTRLTASSISLS